jgi:hypothetical protein
MLYGVQIGPDTMGMIAASIFLSVLITAIMYMAGNFMQSQDIIAKAKDNLGNVVFTGILVLLFGGLYLIFTQLSTAIACEGTPCTHVGAAKAAVDILLGKMWSLYMDMYFYELLFGLLSTLSLSIPITTIDPATLGGLSIVIPSISISPFAGFGPLSNAHTIVVEAISSLMMLTYARAALLDFIGRYIHIFFALGLCLRSFFFTRRTGSSILALCATAFFVYPLAVLFTNYIIFTVYVPGNFGYVPTVVGFCSDPTATQDIADAMISERNELYATQIKPPTSAFGVLWSAIKATGSFLWETGKGVSKSWWTLDGEWYKLIFWAPPMFTTFYDFLMIELQTKVQFIALVTISFVFEIIITITMYRAFADIVEGEAEIFGINKMI